jgi:hypothetical protein
MPGILVAPALGWLCEAFGLALFYLLLTARLNVAEAVAVTAAFLVATLKIGVASSAEWRFAAPFWRQLSLAQAIGALTRDSMIVAMALIHALLRALPPPGAFMCSRFPSRSEAAEQAARRAAAVFLISLAPNSYAVDVDEAKGQIVVHQLLPDRPAIQRGLARLRR